jgi:hypothetical protein
VLLGSDLLLQQMAPRAIATHHGSTYIRDGKPVLSELIQVLRDVHGTPWQPSSSVGSQRAGAVNDAQLDSCAF